MCIFFSGRQFSLYVHGFTLKQIDVLLCVFSFCEEVLSSLYIFLTTVVFRLNYYFQVPTSISQWLWSNVFKSPFLFHNVSFPPLNWCFGSPFISRNSFYSELVLLSFHFYRITVFTLNEYYRSPLLYHNVFFTLNEYIQSPFLYHNDIYTELVIWIHTSVVLQSRLYTELLL